MISLGGESEQKVELHWINFTLVEQDLEGNLSGESQLVLFEETSSRVDVNRESNGVNQVVNSSLDLLGFFSTGDRRGEDNVESLERELVHGMDLVEIIKNEVEQRGSISSRSIMLTSFVNVLFSYLCFLHLDLNFGCGFLCNFKILDKSGIAEEVSRGGGETRQEIIFEFL